MGDLDQSLRRVAQLFPVEWVHFVLSDDTATYLGPAQIELANEPPLQMDTLFHVEVDGEECLIDLEAQAEADKKMGWRLYKYAARASSIFDLPVISVVLWLEKHGRVPTSPFEIRVGKRLLGTWYYVGIEVYNLRATDLLAKGEHMPGILPLLPFTRGGETVEAIESAGQLIQRETSGDNQVALATLLGVLASRKIGHETAMTLVRRWVMSNDLLESSPLYQVWMQEWLEKNRGKWEEEGREEGREEGMRESALLMLRSRFGALPPEVEQAINRADRSTLAAFTPFAVSESLEQLRVRLGV